MAQCELAQRTVHRLIERDDAEYAAADVIVCGSQLCADTILTQLGEASEPPGWIVVEVPHGRDWLIINGPKEFRDFTFW